MAGVKEKSIGDEGRYSYEAFDSSGSLDGYGENDSKNRSNGIMPLMRDPKAMSVIKGLGLSGFVLLLCLPFVNRAYFVDDYYHMQILHFAYFVILKTFL
jgi:hypothetical protein